MNKESMELWVEYIKFEMGFVETLRRRWDVLGITPGKGGNDVEESEGGVEQVMRGAIVKTVIEEASKSLGAKPTFFKSVLELMESFPFSDEDTRTDLKRFIYEQLKESCWETGEGRWLYVLRDLPSVGADVWDVDMLRARHDEMLKVLKEGWTEREQFKKLYENWLKAMLESLDIDELKQFLLLSYKRIRV